jgi:NADH-dependent peroxiredoxin subunit F
VLKSRTVILSTGARWRELNVPGEREYRGRGVAYCPHCDGPLFKGKRVAVIGGGNSGVEAAIDLAGIVGHVTVLEFDETARRRGAAGQARQPAQRDRDHAGADHRGEGDGQR